MEMLEDNLISEFLAKATVLGKQHLLQVDSISGPLTQKLILQRRNTYWIQRDCLYYASWQKLAIDLVI